MIRGVSKNVRILLQTRQKLKSDERYIHSMNNDVCIKSTEIVDPEWESAKDFSEIPGPKPLPIVGNALRFLPGIGEYGNVPTADMFRMLRDKYGDMVKLDGLPGIAGVILIFDPEIAKKVYRTEGPYPRRGGVESLVQYWKNKQKITKQPLTLGLSDGKEWHTVRSAVNPHMMAPRVAMPHVAPVAEVADDFIDKIRKIRDPETLETSESFMTELYKCTLEATCLLAMDERLGCLADDLAPDSDAQTLIECVLTMFDLVYKLEMRPSLWKVYKTPTLKKLERNLDRMLAVTSRRVTAAKERLEANPTKDGDEKTVLQRLLSVDKDIATMMAMDILSGAIHTVGTAMGILMYYVAANPEVQDKLRAEAFRVLPESTSPITFDTLNELRYLKAVIKESMRISPTTISNFRATVSDNVFGGYKVPKGERIVICHSTMTVTDSHFPRPREFIPERWLKNIDGVPSAKEAHPFAYLPFGYGPRTCIGKRFVALEMETFTLKLLRNFKLEWHHEPLVVGTRLVSHIETPLKFKFIDL